MTEAFNEYYYPGDHDWSKMMKTAGSQRRYIVTIRDTDGTIWLNTGSFHLGFGICREAFVAVIQDVISMFRHDNC